MGLSNPQTLAPDDGIDRDLFCGRKVLVIEDDSALSGMLSASLEKCDFAQIDTFSNGKAGWEACARQHYDLVVLDWKTPTLSGAAIFNRMRQLEAYFYSPILVISGFIERKDFRLLEEFPFTGVLEKPFTRKALFRQVEKLLLEDRWFGEHGDVFDRLRRLAEGDEQRFMTTLTTLLGDSPNPQPIGIYIARCLLANKRYSLAEKCLNLVLHIVHQCPLAQTELARLYLMTGRIEKAMPLLKAAQQCSPENIERLCLLGTANINTMDPEGARAYFEKALSIDPEHEEAKNGRSLCLNLADYLSSSLGAVPHTFASLANALGVAQVRSGNVRKGIEYYFQAMRHVLNPHDRSRLGFNLGLAYFRLQELEKAREWFQRSFQESGGRFEKPGRYLDLLREANGPEDLPLMGAEGEVDVVVGDSEGFDEKSQNDMPGSVLPAGEQELPKYSPVGRTTAQGSFSVGEMVRSFPELREAFAQLRARGAYLDQCARDFVRLLGSSDPENFRAALREAIEEKEPSPRNVSFKLQQGHVRKP